MSQKGFTLVDAMVSVAVVGILAAIATPIYHTRIAKAQTAESISMMDSEKVNVVTNLTKKGLCTTDGKKQVIEGKYGSLVVNGTVKADSLKHPGTLLKTGCNLTYTFASSGVSKRLQGKKVSTDLFNNNVLSKASGTNVDASFIPKNLTALSEDSVPTTTVKTETAIVAKDTTGIVEPPAPAGDKTIVASNTRPDGTICKDTYVEKEGEQIVLLGKENIGKTETDFYVRGSTNLYSVFTAKVGRAPKANEVIKFVTSCNIAIVGNHNKLKKEPAITVGNFPATANVTLINFGAILGAGGLTPRPLDEFGIGGDAIYNNSSTKVNIENHYWIAGGGGAGGAGSYNRGAGAPYGDYRLLNGDVVDLSKGEYLSGPQVVATFRTPGEGMDRNYNRPKAIHGWGGPGGGWGERGGIGESTSRLQYKGYPAGKALDGSFTIAVNKGTIKGSDRNLVGK